jgi:hypothetical protein
MGIASKVEKLAAEITSLNEQEQETLWEYVAKLNFRHGLYALSEQYRERLKEQGELDKSANEILMGLRKIRDEIAKNDYPE